MAELITEGPNRGYYTVPGTLIRDQTGEGDEVEVGERDLFLAYKAWQLSLDQDNQIWHRYSPGPGKKIKGFNRSYLPFIDGFYYVRRDPQIDLRRQLYALETKRVPSTGNTETFNKELMKVPVPEDYCPYLIDPCPDTLEWCRRCKAGIQKRSVQRREPLLTTITRWVILALFAVLLAGIATLALSAP